VVEPGLDLAIAVAAASARWDLPCRPGTVLVGEVGLGGEVRAARGTDRRLAEAARLGFTRAIVPAGTRVALDCCRDDVSQKHPPASGLELVEVSDVAAALAAALAGPTGH
jgi:DNA repair protein RadA/Sms